jgi:hypothetical protein
MWRGLCVSGQVHSEASEARQRKLFADDDDLKVRNNLSFSLSQSLYLVLTFFSSPFVSLLLRPLVPRWFKQKGSEFPMQGLWSEWYESGRSVGCLGCSGTSDHNLGCLTLKGSLEHLHVDSMWFCMSWSLCPGRRIVARSWIWFLRT